MVKRKSFNYSFQFIHNNIKKIFKNCVGRKICIKIQRFAEKKVKLLIFSILFKIILKKEKKTILNKKCYAIFLLRIIFLISLNNPIQRCLWNFITITNMYKSLYNNNYKYMKLVNHLIVVTLILFFCKFWILQITFFVIVHIFVVIFSSFAQFCLL